MTWEGSTCEREIHASFSMQHARDQHSVLETTGGHTCRVTRPLPAPATVTWRSRLGQCSASTCVQRDVAMRHMRSGRMLWACMNATLFPERKGAPLQHWSTFPKT